MADLLMVVGITFTAAITFMAVDLVSVKSPKDYEKFAYDKRKLYSCNVPRKGKIIIIIFYFFSEFLFYKRLQIRFIIHN